MKNAATYLRSSKDRKDVSLDSQRRDLEQLAQAKGLRLVEEYSDVVESGKDEDRPGYQKLLAAIGNRERGWDHLLLLDTSRLARRQHIAIAFTHQCHRRGIKILYSKIPEMDPINEILHLSVLRAMDEMHSHMSREKGVAGMAENVRKGYRAGGRAPSGYELEKVDIGLVREGKAVTKSKLVLNADAKQIQKYLRARAGGAPRAIALRDCKLTINPSSAVGIEWNALTYAGNTVWNVHRDFGADGYGGKSKRRPRSEWVIKQDTHEALITNEEAELILKRLENSDVGHAVSAARRGLSSYLLTGLLVSPQGDAWEGSGSADPAYRFRAKGGSKGKLVNAQRLDRAVLNKLSEDLQSDEFVDALYDQSQAQGVDTAERKQKHAELVALTAKIDRAVEAALFLEDPQPIYRKIDALERERKALAVEIEELKQEEEMQRLAKQITKDQIRDLLGGLTDNLVAADQKQVKSLLTSMLDKIELDPVSLEVRLHFRLAAEKWGGMAFPRGFEPLLPP